MSQTLTKTEVKLIICPKINNAYNNNTGICDTMQCKFLHYTEFVLGSMNFFKSLTLVRGSISGLNM